MSRSSSGSGTRQSAPNCSTPTRRQAWPTTSVRCSPRSTPTVTCGRSRSARYCAPCSARSTGSDRRDAERGVAVTGVDLTRGEKVQLLQDIAFWLVRNGWSDAPAERVIGQISLTARQLRTNDAAPQDVFRSLLERSGLLREPAVGRIDFVHRTFQEHLAGKAAAENDEIGLLIKNAHDAQWREVVVMAAGHAQPDQCAELLKGLLRRGRRPRRQSVLWPPAGP